MPPAIVPPVTSFKVLEDWMKTELANLAAKIDSKSVCVKGRWFRILDEFYYALTKKCLRRAVLVVL